MTSITSLVVLLLAAYCFAAPFVPTDDYTTDKAIDERDVMSVTSGDYYTTERSYLHTRGDNDRDGEFTTERSYLHSRGDKDREDEFTTERSYLHARGDKDREDEFTTEGSYLKTRGDKDREDEFTTERSYLKTRGDKDREDEFTTERSYLHTRGDNEKFTTERSLTHARRSESSEEFTTERSDIPQRREERFDGEFTTERFSSHSRREEGSDEEFTTERSDIPQRREERFDSEFTTERSSDNDIPHKRSMPLEDTSMMSERSADANMMDSFVTVESSSAFESRVGNKQQRESVDIDITTVDQPTSSDDSSRGISGTHQERDSLMGQTMTNDQYTATVVPGTSFSEGTTEKNFQPTISRN